MTTEDFKRKLTAILSADVAGYSRLMGDDEAATVKTLNDYREVISTLIQQHRGRVIDITGDNLLADFSSVVDAVRCGLDIQQEIKARNGELPENRRMEFRIGINLGDVIEEGDRIYGDGVNVAARIESLSDRGGIAISGTAYDQVKNKLPLMYEYQGEQSVKNIMEPVRVYRVQMGPEAVAEVKGKKRPMLKRGQWAAVALIAVGVAALAIWNFFPRAAPPSVEPASEEKMAYPLPDKPSIAVLPFVNMSDDPEQEYFSDGITEEIITALSRVPHLFVIARNSTFTYKGKSVKVQQVGRELGVRYVLEGSVRKEAERVRITAQLIDTTTGHYLWAERYDRELKGLFALQDEIALKIITALQVELTEGEAARVYGRGTKNLEAYVKVMQGREYAQRFNKEGNALAQKMFEEAIAMDPEYAMAYWRLSATHLMDLIFGSTKSPKQSLEQAEELANKALALDGAMAEAHALLGRIYLTKGQYEKAIEEGERALALDPNSYIAQYALAFTLNYSGKPEEAIALFKKAMRVNPIPPLSLLTMLGSAYRNAGRYEEGIATYKKVLDRSPDNLIAHLGLASVYSLSGRKEAARAEVAEVLRIDPNFSIDYLAKGSMYKNQSDENLMIESLRKAGLK